MTNEELVVEIQAGVNVLDNLGKLYQQNLYLIEKTVKPYEVYCEHDDLMQEAYFGLQKAASKFDSSIGCKFISYALWYVKAEVGRYSKNNSGNKRIPENLLHSISLYKQFVNDFRVKHEIAPTPDEVMKGMQIQKSKYNAIIKTLAEMDTVSIYQEIDDDFTIGDTIPDNANVEETVVEKIMKESIWKQVDLLPNEQSEIIHMKFEGNLTNQSIGNVKGVTEQHIISNKITPAITPAITGIFIINPPFFLCIHIPL